MSTNGESNGGFKGSPLNATEPVAIVGIGCRMPGGIRGPNDFWKLLMSRGIAKSEKVPKSRFNIDAYLHPENDRPGSFNVPGGFFLDDDLEAFDPSMFGISPVEAHCMDPQQRKLLECVYEAFESSGTSLDEAKGKRTGCYIGCFTLDFLHMTMKEPDFRHSYTAMGVDTGLLANRISHVFDLKGPSITLNTACSSSLHALDLACKAIACGECDSAIIGGVNLMMTVDQQMNTAKMGVLSPNSQSRPFDESADGYARAEGMGALLLKPLSAALKDGDPIRSLIRSTACTSNGRNEDGLSHPQGKGQKDAISLAYNLGNLKPGETSYVECHGTGTIVGDPIEVIAIHEAMGTIRPNDQPVLIGSVKANVGHSETASSIATLIKATLALENGLIPPTAGITRLNPSIPWVDLNVRVVIEPTPFPSTLRRVGINAFGYGGTNAHTILESVHSLVPGYHNHRSILRAETEVMNPTGDNLGEERLHLLLFSAHNRPTVEKNLHDISSSGLETCIFDLAYTLGCRRTKFEERTFAVSRKQTFTSDINAASMEITGKPTTRGIPAFVFTGQGAQWSHMGSYLLKLCPSVLQTIRNLDQYLSTLNSPPAWRIEEVLMDPKQAYLVDKSEYSQPLCTALQIALVDLMTRWGVKAVATIGHSSGEIAAAYAAGIISAENAITIAYFRGKVTTAINTDGAMVSVGIGAKEAEEYIDQDMYRGRVVVACHNSPSSVTLSGDRDVIDKLKESFDSKKVFARVLKTGGKAYHSHHMTQAASKYLECLREEPISGQHYLSEVPMYSTVWSGRLQSSKDTYWIENLTSPVLFNQGIACMLENMPDINMLIEVGPHSACSGPLRQICQAINKTHVLYLPTLKRQEHDLCQMLRLAGNLWIQDASIDTEAVIGVEKLNQYGSIENHTGLLLVDLPTYHWMYPKPALAESRTSKEHRTMKEPRHDILGRRVIGTSPLEPLWRNVLCLRDLPWLAQHKLAGEVMLPATGYLALAMEAIRQVNSQAQEPLEIKSYTLRDVIISTATVVPDDDNGIETLFRLRPINSKLDISQNWKTSPWYEFVSSACSYGAWKETARGLVGINMRGEAINHIAQILPDTPHRGKHIDWTNRGKELGFDFGSVFHHIDDIYTDGKTHIVRGDMHISQDCGLMNAESRYVLHPTVLDSCLQPFPAMVHKGHLEKFRCGVIPTHFGEFTVFQPSAIQLANKCLVQLWANELGNRSYSSNIQLIAHDGSLLIDATDSRCQLYPTALPQEMQGNTQRDLYIEHVWKIDCDYLAWARDAGLLSHGMLSTLVDAFLHKDAATRVLCLDYTLIPDILAVRPDLPMVIGCSSEEEKLIAASIQSSSDMVKFVNTIEATKAQEQYDLIIISEPEQTGLHELRGIMSSGGHLILRIGANDPGSWDSVLKSAGFSGIEQYLSGMIVTTVADLYPAVNGVTNHVFGEILLVYHHAPNSLHSNISSRLQQDGWKVLSQAVSSIDQVPCAQVILIADAEGPFLANIEEEDLEGLIKLTEGASAITWVTCGGLLAGEKPEYGMTLGTAQAIRKERGSMSLVTVDFDTDTTEHLVADLLAQIVDRQDRKIQVGETDYRFQNGVLYIGRLVSNKILNRDFVSDSGETTTLHQRDRAALKAQLEGGKIVYRRTNELQPDSLGPDEVDVRIAAIGLSASDGADGSTFLSHEMVGTVIRVGSNVKGIVPSSYVAGFVLEELSTFQRTSCNLVDVVPKESSLTEIATLPSAFVTAIYGLQELARTRPGENVVILDDIGAVGHAAVQLCRVLDANAIVVTTSPATEALLRNSGQISSTTIVPGRNGNIGNQLKKITAGCGIDVIFCSTDTDEKMVIECGRSMAPFGRMVTLGRAGDYRSTCSEVSSSTSCLSFFQFELETILKRRPNIVATILKQCLELYKTNRIEALKPIQVKRPVEVDEAIRSIPSDMGSGKYVVAYDGNAVFKAASSIQPLAFRQDVTYLLVGCLGGLGRQIALWMADRGAKYLAFVSRSGINNPAAAETVQLLKDHGVNCVVLRANIADRDQVGRAVAEIDPKVPIRGVLNAASVFHDSIFNNMTIGAWKEVTDSKVKGSLNLHEVLKDQPLDFFVMTSSVASTIGSSGQANYSAGNSFLDSLAVHRHAHGLPAISLILPAIFGIGHISEHRELEKAIQMKGMYGIREKEMLEAFEVAMRPQSLLPAGIHHIIVGLQPRRFGAAVKAAGAQILSKENATLNWMATAIDKQVGGDSKSRISDSGSSQDIQAVISKGGDRDEAIAAVTSYLSRRLGRVLMIEEDSIQPTQKSIASHGLDSMIGAEFRNWIFREFKMDVPFQQLLAGSLTISELAQMICKNWVNAIGE